MAASVRQQLVERALTAEKLLEQLSPCLIKLKEATGTLILLVILVILLVIVIVIDVLYFLILFFII